ncbi:MAG: hypothetical protein JXA67_10060, partial [Micromonosporaceae bacterium]|nr:hypothetical protein [Micromonosporaceae bacterium]
MGVSTVVFLAIGGLALLLLVLSLVGGHLALGDVDFGPLHLDHVPGFGHVDGGMQLTLPAIAGFLGAFGFSGAAVTSVAGDS